MFANIELQLKNRKLIYCHPPKLALQPEQMINMIKEHIKENSFYLTQQTPLGGVALEALKETFP